MNYNHQEVEKKWQSYWLNNKTFACDAWDFDKPKCYVLDLSLIHISLTIADYDREKGTITIIFQIVGKTTMLLNQLNVGDSILDFVGPLGKPSHVDGLSLIHISRLPLLFQWRESLPLRFPRKFPEWTFRPFR